MGFGWLLLGYVVSFFLYSAASMLNFGFLAHLLGYLLMLYGLCELQKYNRAFRFPVVWLCVLLPLTVYGALQELGSLLLWQLPFVTETVTQIVGWVEFAGILLFHFGLYRAIARIAQSVSLPRTVRDAIFDTVVGAGYAILYLVSKLPVLSNAAVQFSVPLTILLLFWRICDLCLLIACCKNICRAGDEEQAPHRYRLELLNWIGDAFERNFQRAADSTRASYEERLKQKPGGRKKR